MGPDLESYHRLRSIGHPNTSCMVSRRTLCWEIADSISSSAENEAALCRSLTMLALDFPRPKYGYASNSDNDTFFSAQTALSTRSNTLGSQPKHTPFRGKLRDVDAL